MKLPIYMDYSATTPVDKRVAEKMIPFITEEFGQGRSDLKILHPHFLSSLIPA